MYVITPALFHELTSKILKTLYLTTQSCRAEQLHFKQRELQRGAQKLWKEIAFWKN